MTARVMVQTFTSFSVRFRIPRTYHSLTSMLYEPILRPVLCKCYAVIVAKSLRLDCRCHVLVLLFVPELVSLYAFVWRCEGSGGRTINSLSVSYEILPDQLVELVERGEKGTDKRQSLF